MGLVILFWGLLVAPQTALSLDVESDKVFRVTLQNENQVNFLKNLVSILKLDIWYPDSVYHLVAGTDVDLHVRSNLTSLVQVMLEQNGTQYEILLDNLQEEIKKQFEEGRRFLKKHSYTKYNDWETIAAWTERMARNYPKLISRTEIGRTYEDRPMYLLQVGKESGRKKAIFMDCGVHAREWISPAFCQWFVKQAVKTYGKDKVMTKLLDSMNFYVLPVFNVDGYVWTWRNPKTRMWRKNRAINGDSGCIGVDLNRNFNASWGNKEEERMLDPCDEIYCGPSAESEPETRAVTSFIRDHLSAIKGYISVHSYSQMLLFPYGYTDKEAPNHDELNEVAKKAVEALSSLYHTKYIYGPIGSTIYPCFGSSADWAYDEGIKYSFAFELRDRGRYGFLLPVSKIKSTCKETMLAVKYIANHIFTFVS